MPQIANTHTLPEWENGYLLAGNLKTASGIATLNISGNWSATDFPSGLTILCNSQNATFYSVPFVSAYSTATKLTTIQFKIYNTSDGIISTDSDIKIHYLVWVNNTATKTLLPIALETINL